MRPNQRIISASHHSIRCNAAPEGLLRSAEFRRDRARPLPVGHLGKRKQHGRANGPVRRRVDAYTRQRAPEPQPKFLQKTVPRVCRRFFDWKRVLDRAQARPRVSAPGWGADFACGCGWLVMVIRIARVKSIFVLGRLSRPKNICW